MSDAAELFETFTGYDRTIGPDVRLRIPADVARELPKELTLLGRALAIEYEVAKEHDDGQIAPYRHEFTDPAFLAAAGGRQVLIIVGDFVVIDRGITDFSER